MPPPYHSPIVNIVEHSYNFWGRLVPGDSEYTAMASKRVAEDETESKAPRTKRHKTRTDPISGQRGVFGDLASGTTAPAGDSDLDCEDDSAALSYLRSVRTQASAIPHVLAAKKAGPSLPPQLSEENRDDGRALPTDRTIYEDGVGDFRGYYQDGAYVAYPEDHWAGDEDDEDDEEGEKDGAGSASDNDLDASESGEDRPHNSSADEIRDAYFASITNRYLALRKLLQISPPGSAVNALPATNPTEVGAWKRGVDTFRKWENRLKETDPLPAQVAAMHKDSVFRLLRVLLARKFLRKRTQLHERTSRWIWALLARLPDKGELDYMEVGWIRELGKRAVLMMVSLAELEVLREHCDVAGSSPDDQDGYEVGVHVDECFDDDDDLSQDTSINALDAPTPEMTEENVEDTSNPEILATSNHAHQSPRSCTNADSKADTAPLRRPSLDNISDVEMQLDSDMEDGEVADEPPSLPSSEPITDIEAAKAQLLARLADDTIGGGGVEEDNMSAPGTPDTQHPSAARLPETEAERNVDIQAGNEEQQQEEQYEDEADYETEEDEEDAASERYRELDRTRVNERATLNMILTVAGELYGQRDLLEFRDPFGGLQFA
ncbi:hypothetical protein F4802DRAFT_583067 [Xylaria palmicola]|nr:hypothetical protein F4802DRAFT_583067 [Xylaria palmicola]